VFKNKPLPKEDSMSTVAINGVKLFGKLILAVGALKTVEAAGNVMTKGFVWTKNKFKKK